MARRMTVQQFMEDRNKAHPGGRDSQTSGKLIGLLNQSMKLTKTISSTVSNSAQNESLLVEHSTREYPRL